MSIFQAKPKKKGKYTYKKHSELANQWQKNLVAAGQEIGDLPPVVNPKRKEASKNSLEKFCKTYFPEAFIKPFCDDHRKTIKRIEHCVFKGGLYARAMPRGSGKTTLMQAAMMWVGCYGHCKFAVIVGAAAEKALDLLEDIKIWYETNDLLNEDFPEICFPIRKLERITHRQRGQKYHGKPTRIEWAGNKIHLPTIEGSDSSGVILSASGLKGSDIRGQKAISPDGGVIRPDFVLIDDPQTRETAESPTQCAKREKIIAGDILGMAGPGKQIAAFITCTVIQQGDMADRILDRKLHPEWHGERSKMLIAEPINTKLWEEYEDILKDEHRNDGDGSVATAFYKKNRKNMDEGAMVYWKERYEPSEISAIQSAMNLKIRDALAFAAEYQNEPLDDAMNEEMLTVDEISNKLNRINKGVVPIGVNHLTAFIDVQKEILFYAVCGFSDDFTGYVIDYGTYPEQTTHNISLRTLHNTISRKHPKMGFEGAMHEALTALTDMLASKTYISEQQQQEKIKLCLIDANWGESTDVVYQICRRSQHSNILMPAHGVFVGAVSKPFSEYKKHKGDRIGSHWRIPSMAGKRAIRHVLTDVNYWKSFVHSRLQTAIGDRGSLTFYGKKPQTHISIASHLTAEYKVAVTAKGRTVNEWKIRPEKPENHWFDCIVGSAAAASICGAKLPGVQDVNFKGKNKKRISLSELQKQRRVV
jgi:uncharacterized protein YfkK (UPF0435 family)